MTTSIPEPTAIEPDTTAPRPTGRHGWVLGVVLLACIAPVAVAAVVTALRGWTPVGEFAQAEMRVRDFWADPPLLGAVGRLRTDTDVSSHPGPAAWWAMYPVYAAFGRSAVALSLAVATTAAAWMGAAIVLAWRRGGDALAVILGVGVLTLMAAVGPISMVEPWNPWFAVMPFLCLVVATWLVVDGRPWALVAVVAAGSYCVQAHLGYAPLVAALGAVALGGLWRSGARGGTRWTQIRGPLLVAALVGAAMWALPVAEQVTGDPGNMSILVRAWSEESERESPLGIPAAVELVVSHLVVTSPGLTGDDIDATSTGNVVLGLLVVVLWAVVVGLAWLRRSTERLASALRLHLVLAVAAASAVLAASRVVGEVFGYLVLWLAVLAAVLHAAILWTGWLLLVDHESRNVPAGPPSEVPPSDRALATARVAGVVAIVALVAGSAWLCVDFAGVGAPGGDRSDEADQLVSEVVDELDPDGDYLVRWEDPLAFGGLGTAVLSELERAGYSAGVDDRLRVEMRPHRVMPESDATAALWVVTGAGIDRWDDVPGAVRIASVELRTPQEARRSADERRDVVDALVELGAPDLAEELDDNYWIVRTDPRVPRELRDRIDELVAAGLPTAVFLVPPDTVQPAAGG